MMFLEGSLGWFGGLCGVLVGLILGSFAGMASWRWPREEGWSGASRCPQCGHRLGMRELVPVISWLVQRGKTACCRKPLSSRYAWLEGVSAAIMGIVGWFFGVSAESFLLWGMITALLIGSMIDLEWGLVPDGVSITVALTGCFWLWLHPPAFWWEPVLSVAQVGGVAIMLAWGYSRLRGRDMLGWGDVKLMAGSGLWLIPLLGGAYLSVAAVLGVVFGGIWRLRGGEEAFPFVPALSISLVALIFWQAFFR